jgi:hypothetical protein
MAWRALAVPVILALGLGLATRAAPQTPDPIRIDGEIVRGGEVKIDIVVEVTEDYATGGQGKTPAQLEPVRKRLTLLISAPGRIASLDAQFPAAALVSRFTIEPGDGRAFTNCVVTGFKFEGAGRQRYLYSLRCEDVSS